MIDIKISLYLRDTLGYCQIGTSNILLIPLLAFKAEKKLQVSGLSSPFLLSPSQLLLCFSSYDGCIKCKGFPGEENPGEKLDRRLANDQSRFNPYLKSHFR